MPREYKFEKQLLRVNLDSEADESVFREIFLDRDYGMIDDLIRKATHAILDIGAHIGLFSMYARCLNDRVPIFAYEPAPENFAALKEHFKSNRIDGVTAKNVAVTAHNGTVQLHLSSDSHNHSIVRIADDSKPMQAPAVSMQTIFEKNNLSFCDLVKMDCEGAEFEILPPMDADLFKKIGAFYLEYHEYQDGQRKEMLADLLRRHGFKVTVAGSRYDKRLGFIFAHR